MSVIVWPLSMFGDAGVIAPATNAGFMVNDALCMLFTVTAVVAESIIMTFAFTVFVAIAAVVWKVRVFDLVDMVFTRSRIWEFMVLNMNMFEL